MNPRGRLRRRRGQVSEKVKALFVSIALFVSTEKPQDSAALAFVFRCAKNVPVLNPNRLCGTHVRVSLRETRT